ncbi:MAG: slipin family protein [Saprospiraceae bacterium]|jgi:regulator of protease activity HflC (stomatin/prohibitin superfamily)|nr:slipin family protein [Saprospiraceae bacterium]MBK7339966.1 slipin family protein [Saprospiraceae bacterium]MBK7796329.1 slipin family protein [Saprospiraceae bacterium]MBK9378347.1 slipin family protein [Saprospiraceae bacterium]
MAIFKRQLQVKPNTIGYLYRDNNFEQTLNSGYHEFWDFKNRIELFSLPTTSKLICVTNQEVLTKDNVALRFSFNILYKITDGQKLLTQFSLDRQTVYIIQELEQRICNIVQIFLRDRIAEMDSETLNEKRNELTEFKTEEMENQVAQFGVTIEQAQLKDLTFPKTIQDLFSKHLEAKVRAKADLENARTAVATARTLKNASELMKGDDNIKFFQLLETIGKIAEKGKHTFNFGDITQMAKNENGK